LNVFLVRHIALDCEGRLAARRDALGHRADLRLAASGNYDGSAPRRECARTRVDVGDDVLFGAGVELIPHLMTRNERGEMELLLAPIRIGARAVVGGYSLLAAGTEIPPDEATRAHLLSPPFT
jgi:hypothetical protein